MSTAIATREAGALAPAAEWNREKVELVKRTVCPQGIGDHEFALFIEQCKRSGLDPLIKQAFCVERRMKLPNGQWGSKHEFQPAEAGMLARAEAFPDFGGITAAAVHANDEIEIDPGAGVVVHKFRPGKDRGPIVGAWARLCRAGKPAVVTWVDFDAYAQTVNDKQSGRRVLNSMWEKLGDTMITKCARVAALRVAYPAAFGGLYIREEMPPEEYVQREAPVVRAPPPRQEQQRQDVTEGEIVQPAQLPSGQWEMEIRLAEEAIAKASDEAEVMAAGKAIAEAYPDKAHPVRKAVGAKWNERLLEVKKAGVANG